MFNNRYIPVLLFPLLVCLALPAQAFVGGIAVSIGRATNIEGAEIPPFSADAQLETQEHQLNSQVYYRPGMVRDVTTVSGMEMVTIQRFDQHKVWVLMGQGMYMESEIGEAEQAPEYELIERTVEGKETVNGMETTKYKTIYQGPDGRFEGVTWFTHDNIAVKGFIVSETKGEKQQLQWSMTNVQRGQQPAALFELPPGAKPMGALGGLMNMISGKSSAAAGPADPNAPGNDAGLKDTANSVLKGVSEGFGKLFGN